MTACPANCGACCDPVILAFPLEGLQAHDTPSGRFAAKHWRLRDTQPDDEYQHHITCDQFDPDTRACLAYENRPPICSGFPWYGREPAAEARNLPNVCAFHDDVPGRRVLPLVEVA